METVQIQRTRRTDYRVKGILEETPARIAWQPRSSSAEGLTSHPPPAYNNNRKTKHNIVVIYSINSCYSRQLNT